MNNATELSAKIEKITVNMHVIASAILNGQEIELSELLKIDTTPTKAKRSDEHSFIILECIEIAKGKPTKSTRNITPLDIENSYHDHLIKNGEKKEEADKKSEAIYHLKNYRNPKPSVLNKELNKLIAREHSWMNEWVLMPDGRYFDTLTGALGKTSWFNNSIACVYDLPFNNNGEITLASKYSIGKLQSVSGIAYHPKEKRIFNSDGLIMANTYLKFTPDSEICDIKQAEELINTHLRRLLDDDTADFMLDWMAHQVQNPGTLVRYTPLIIGKVGDGKTTISEILTVALGDANVYVIGDGEFKSAFTDWANKGALGVIEEIRLNGDERWNIYNKIKPFITNKKIGINRKGLPSMNVMNVTNYIAFSNYGDAMPIGEYDRRFWVIHSKSFNDNMYEIETPESVAYFDNIYALMEGNSRGIYRYLERHEISDKFKCTRTAPMTIAKEEMKTESLPAGTKALIERIGKLGQSIIVDGFLSLTKLKSQGSCSLEYEYDLPTNRALSDGLKSLGWEKIPQKRISGQVSTYYKKV